VLLTALRLAGLLYGETPKRSAAPLFALPFAAVWLCNAPAGVIAIILWRYSSLARLFPTFVENRASCRCGLALGFGLAGFICFQRL